MSIVLEQNNFKTAQTLLAVAIEIETEHEVLERILEESGYSDCEFDTIDKIDLHMNAFGQLMLAVDISFFDDNAEPEEDGTMLNSEGVIYIKYDGEKIVAEF